MYYVANFLSYLRILVKLKLKLFEHSLASHVLCGEDYILTHHQILAQNSPSLDPIRTRSKKLWWVAYLHLTECVSVYYLLSPLEEELNIALNLSERLPTGRSF